MNVKQHSRADHLRVLLCGLALAAAFSVPVAANGSGAALIVNDGTVGLEANVVSNLSGKLTSAGYTVTTATSVPGGSLATYKQIWDVRFNNTTPLTPADISAYVTYMAGGGSLFVMGENTGFVTRNNSIISLIQTAGGGTITVTNPVSNTQTVLAPFTGPNSLSTLTFLAAAATANPASGGRITTDGSNLSAAIVYGPGNMSNAPAGSLLVVFDVNFLDLSADSNSQTFTNNLIAYLAAPTPIPGSVPSPSSLLLLVVGAAGVGAIEFIRRKRAVAAGQ